MNVLEMNQIVNENVCTLCDILDKNLVFLCRHTTCLVLFGMNGISYYDIDSMIK